MSLSAKSITVSRNARISRIEEAEAINEIQDFLNGCYELRPWELSQEEGNWVAENRHIGIEKLIATLKEQGKSAGARYIAARILSGESPEYMGQLAKDWWCHRAIKRELSEQELREIGARPMDLRMIGIKTGWQARRFYDLYREVQVKDRPWGSCYQVRQVKVLALATTPNFNRLPMWVKKGLVEYAPYIHTERVGNIWRLLDCVRAWKWNSNLPKGIAEKIGKRPARSRILAALAWHEIGGPNFAAYRNRGWVDSEYDYDQDCTVEWDVSRSDIVNKFWLKYRELERKPLASLLENIMDWRLEWGSHKTRSVMEIFLGLPYESLADEWVIGPRHEDDRKKPSSDRILEIICTYGSPKDACKHLFGVSGKGTVKAFQQCQSKDAWKWASALAQGNADAVQKILAMDSLIAWEPDAVDFLLSLPMVSRLRMLQATTFRYRGQTCEITPDHVRDTGYLWKNIQNKPELGRIRCWFSVHETLAAAFVKELPDEALPIPAGWERLDGLCAVDGSWELEFPKRIATLKYYGEILHNCVGGYGPAIKQGRSVIFVVREQGQLTHCVEYEGHTCRQFYRAHNGNPDYGVKESVQGAIAQAFDLNFNW